MCFFSFFSKGFSLVCGWRYSTHIWSLPGEKSANNGGALDPPPPLQNPQILRSPRCWKWKLCVKSCANLYVFFFSLSHSQWSQTFLNPEGEISQRKINANTFIKRDKVSVPSPSRLNELVSCANQWHIRLILLLARALIGVFGRIITFEALGVFSFCCCCCFFFSFF